MFVSRTPGERQSEPAIWREKKDYWLAGREVSSRWEAWRRGLSSPFMMLIAYRHPLTVSSQLTVKVDETDSQGKHTAPSSSLPKTTTSDVSCPK